MLPHIKFETDTDKIRHLYEKLAEEHKVLSNIYKELASYMYEPDEDDIFEEDAKC